MDDDDLLARVALPPAAAPAADDDPELSFLKRKKDRRASDDDLLARVAAPAPAPAGRTFKNTGPDLAGQSRADAAELAARPGPLDEFVARTKHSFENLGHTVAGAALGAVDLASPVDTQGHLQFPFSKLAGGLSLDPSDSGNPGGAYRRQFLRGVSDTSTFGGAEKLANMADPNFASLSVPDAADAPNARPVGQFTGMALPGPGKILAGSAAAMVPGVGIGSQVARGIAAYEGAAVPQAATQAALNAPEGERLRAALDAGAYAATDPAGLALSAGIPAATAGARALGDTAAGRAVRAPVEDAVTAVKESRPAEIAGNAMDEAVAARNAVRDSVAERAKRAAVKDIGTDIVSADGPRARVTDQKRIKEVNDQLFDLTQRNPELRSVWRKPADKALPALRKFMQKVIEPRNEIYDEIDAATVPHDHVVDAAAGAEAGGEVNLDAAPTGGGIRLGDIVDGYRERAAELRKRPEGLEEAGRLNKMADRELESAAYRQGSRVEFDPATKINEEGTTAGQQIEMLEKSASVAERSGDQKTASALRDEVARTRETATRPAEGVDLDERVPSAVFRDSVTDLLKTANSVMGGLEGTPKYEAAQRLYGTAKDILNEHIDQSGIPAARAKQLRQMNSDYFLLKRAEAAIESRGWKEATRHKSLFSVHGARQAAEALSPAAMVGYGVMHPQAAIPMAATYAGVRALPAIRSRINWKLANMGQDPPAGAAPAVTGSSSVAVARLVAAARAGASNAQIRAQAEKDGVDQAVVDNLLLSRR